MQEMEICFPGKEQFILQPCEPSEALLPNEVRGRTIATLVSPGTELAWATGEDFPIRPGYSAVFEVQERGADVSIASIGDLLFCMGSHRSYQHVDVAHTVAIPSEIKPETALLARLVGVSMTTLMTTKARPGDPVVICGAGPVGYLAAHIFRIGGYDVTVVEPDAKRRAQAQDSGLRSVFAAFPFERPELAGQVALVVDCSGHEQAVLDGCRIVRQNGEVVLVGVPWRRQADLSAHELLNAVFNGFVELRSGWEWAFPLVSRSFKWEELLEGYNNSSQSIMAGFRKAMKWLAEDRIPLEGMVRIETPDEPEKVYRALLERSVDEPFVVLDWRELHTRY
ncbi:zinc-binding dehydrogenase [Paraburkholderia domus]|jgi:Threonine dehydrogenase and related Zn-dependent dehydrogenases|uniref:zinc-binding dehydrogenase n=1 Tax=Paraburkholderia domus TaxID=2793075 RepID=UPI001913F597|nr:zinc-binding dehydrogenase [Paraburkholderia domus]MBK5065636.1 zinc-binding dehydrogenase [Burkholderia sp. R-70199]CAE6961484.1 L-threonine 3-dehydrogenase [Paraburkholderia domus]